MNWFANKIGLWKIPLLCLLTGAILRLLYLCSFASLPLCNFPCGPDIGEYIADMQSILAGRIPSEMIHGPLYGYVLAALYTICNGNLFLVRLFQSFLVLTAGIPFFLILKRKCPPRSFTPGLFLLLYCIYPPFIIWQCDFYSENIMLFCCSWALFCLAKSDMPHTKKSNWIFAAGVLCGCAIISHPMAAFFAAGTVILFLIRKKWKKQTIQKIILFSAGVILLLAPVSINRSFRAGKPVLIQQNSGFNIFLGNHDAANGTCRIPPGDDWNRIHAEAGKSPEGSDRYFLSRTKDFILHHPFLWGKLLLKKAIMVFSATEFTTWSDVTVLQLLFFHKIFYYCFPVIGICAVASLIFLLTDRRKRIKYQLFLTLFFSFYLAQILLLTSGRYRIACVVMMLVFAAALPDLLKEKWKSSVSGQKRIIQLAIPLLCGMIPVFLPLHRPDIEQEKSVAKMILAESWNLSGNKNKAEQILLSIPEPERMQSATILNLLGTIQLENGKLQEAEKNLRLAHKIYPEYPNPLLNLGKLSENTDPRFSAQCYHAALKYAKPETREILLFNLGVLYQKHGNLKLAEQYYREIFKWNPESIRPCRNLAILLLNKKDFSGAEQLLRKAWNAEKNDPERNVDLAYVLLTAGKKMEAEKILRNLLKKHPNHPAAVDLLKQISRKSGS